jgi:hypothetical protein
MLSCRIPERKLPRSISENGLDDNENAAGNGKKARSA